jgi:hypothetical protein
MNGTEPQTASSIARAAAVHELEALRWDWGDAYEIEHGDEDGWRAKRRDGLGGWLTAASSGDLFPRLACVDLVAWPLVGGTAGPGRPVEPH